MNVEHIKELARLARTRNEAQTAADNPAPERPDHAAPPKRKRGKTAP